MPTVRIYFGDGSADSIAEPFNRSYQRGRARVTQAIQQAAKDAAADIETQGRENIAASGHFGFRWTEGLHAKVTQGGGNIRITITHDLPYFRVFQNGALIKGKPLLWIPLSSAPDAQGIYARDFPGRLFRVDRKNGGKPLLMSAADKQAKYFGAESVTIPKKFRVVEIAQEIGRKLRDYYRTRYREAGV